MNTAVPMASVNDYEALIPSIVLPDPNDRHVVAAGAKAGASVIVTWNVRDFPAIELRKYGLKKETPPDIFLTGLYHRMPDIMLSAVARARANLRRSKVSAEEFIQGLRHQKLTRFTSEIEPLLARL
jgi:hypothetical protein